MKIGIALGMGLFVLAVMLGIVQLWFEPLAIEFFVKAEMTIAAFLVVLCVVVFVAKELRENKVNSSGDHLDN